MVTMLKGILPKSNILLCVKGLSAKNIHNEMFPVYGGKRLSCKVLHNWVKKHGKLFSDEEAEMDMWKWLRQQSKDFYVAGLYTGKAMGQVYQCWWRIGLVINVFFWVWIDILYALYTFVTYLLTVPRICSYEKFACFLNDTRYGSHFLLNFKYLVPLVVLMC
jgi:hypothetical protein